MNKDLLMDLYLVMIQLNAFVNISILTLILSARLMLMLCCFLILTFVPQMTRGSPDTSSEKAEDFSIMK